MTTHFKKTDHYRYIEMGKRKREIQENKNNIHGEKSRKCLQYTRFCKRYSRKEQQQMMIL